MTVTGVCHCEEPERNEGDAAISPIDNGSGRKYHIPAVGFSRLLHVIISHQIQQEFL
jgi:hypothetical protein